MLSDQSALVQVNFDGESTESSEEESCLTVVQSLLRRCLTDEVLHKAYDAVENAENPTSRTKVS